MRVLFLSHALEPSGWGQAARDYALALDAAGAEVVCRHVPASNARVEPTGRLKEFFSRDPRGCDAVLQHLLPDLFSYDGRSGPCVGMFATETSRFCPAWADRANLMDAAVVFNRQSAEACRASGVTVPVSVVPHASDLSRFQKSHPHLEPLRPYKDAGDFLFYFVGEFVRRKNLSALLKAFHLEFDPSERVQLVIKTSLPGASPDECYARVDELCTRVKEGLRLHGGRVACYKPELIFTERLSPEGVMRLHAACDCFVMPSFGESHCIPCFDAMAMGKTPIATACTGFLDYLSDETGWPVECKKEPCFAATDALPNVYTGDEEWWAVDVGHLRRCMREAFRESALRRRKAVAGVVRSYDFGYEAVGSLLKEVLHAAPGRALGADAGPVVP